MMATVLICLLAIFGGPWYRDSLNCLNNLLFGLAGLFVAIQGVPWSRATEAIKATFRFSGGCKE